MKRLRTLTLTLLALALCLGAVAAGAEEVYMSLFDSGYDGWYARSTGSATLEASSGSLVITGRSQDWHSPGRDFNLVPGQQYELGVQVFQDQQPSATFLISIAHTKNGRETYENLGRGEAKQGEWTGISGSYLAGDYDKSVLYVETLGAPELSFRIKAFSVLAPRMERATGLPALKDLYRDYFDFGCAVTYREAVNTQLMDFYASQFSIMTHGNELKPDSVLDVPVQAVPSFLVAGKATFSFPGQEMTLQPTAPFAWRSVVPPAGTALADGAMPGADPLVPVADAVPPLVPLHKGHSSENASPALQMGESLPGYELPYDEFREEWPED